MIGGRVAVVGAGLVGSVLADALRALGCEPVLFDPALAARDPSSAQIDAFPVGLMHPAPGRRAAISQRRAAAFDQAGRYLEELLEAPAPPGTGVLRTGSPPTGFLRTGLLRVTSSPELVPVWQKTAARWSDRLEWLGPEQVLERVPGATERALGGLWIPDAVTVDGRALVRSARARSGAERRPRAAIALEPGPRVVTDDGVELFDAVIVSAALGTAGLLARTADRPVRAAGAGSPPGTDLALVGVPGQLLVATCAAPPVPFGELGQIVPLAPDRVALTATHRAPTVPGVVADARARNAPGAGHPSDAGVSSWGVAELLRRAAVVYTPALGADPIAAWSGVRTSTRARRPLVGEAADRVWVCTGFGSKGLSEGIPCARSLATLVAARLGVAGVRQ